MATNRLPRKIFEFAASAQRLALGTLFHAIPIRRALAAWRAARKCL